MNLEVALTCIDCMLTLLIISTAWWIDRMLKQWIASNREFLDQMEVQTEIVAQLVRTERSE